MNRIFRKALQSDIGGIWFKICKLSLCLLALSHPLTSIAALSRDLKETRLESLNGAWQCHAKLSDGIYLEINTTDVFLDNGLLVSVGSMVMMPAQGFTTLDYTISQYFSWHETKKGLSLTVTHSDIKNLSGSGHDEIFPIQKIFYEQGDTFLLPVKWQENELLLKKHNGNLESTCNAIQP
ncbi:hypothetical protein KUL154_56440 [Alteromonas sp. KUL154]|nr:hypothetical protein KUL154_56440 [Alteromonas sp. KUL154]